MKKPTTYKSAGVDIEKAEHSLKQLKARIEETHTPRVIKGVGLFGGFFDLNNLDIEHPVLVASTDGVGTKLKIAMMTGRHDTIGQDLVHHCINDIAVSGAHPLFFLDYFASGRLESGVFEEVVSGITIACKNANIPLLGGETAEMPDFYQPGDYDLCGTIVGVVEKEKIIDGSQIEKGDILIGVHSNGLHTNGFTLARKVLFSKYSPDEFIPSLNTTLAEELLKIHRNYYPLIQQVLTQFTVRGIAHITGGGLVKNIPRLFRKGLSMRIDWKSWEIPPIFQLIQNTGNVPMEDMQTTFNMGIGLVFIIPKNEVDSLFSFGNSIGERMMKIGEIV